MKYNWQIRRQSVAYPDGQRRWDRAYQFLLEWSQPTMQRVSIQQEMAPETQNPNAGLELKEDSNE